MKNVKTSDSTNYNTYTIFTTIHIHKILSDEPDERWYHMPHKALSNMFIEVDGSFVSSQEGLKMHIVLIFKAFYIHFI